MHDGLLMHRLVCYTAMILGYKRVNKLTGANFITSIMIPTCSNKVFQFTVVGSSFTHLSFAYVFINDHTVLTLTKG